MRSYFVEGQHAVDMERDAHIGRVDVDQFGHLYQQFMEAIVNGRQRETAFLTILRNHFGVGPDTLAPIGLALTRAERPNLQVALDAFVGESGVTARRGEVSTRALVAALHLKAGSPIRLALGIDPSRKLPPVGNRRPNDVNRHCEILGDRYR